MAALREKVTAAAMRESASSTRLEPAKVVPGGGLVSTRSRSTETLRRETSAYRKEKGASTMRLINELREEGVLVDPHARSLPQSQYNLTSLGASTSRVALLQTTSSRRSLTASDGVPLLSHEQLRAKAYERVFRGKSIQPYALSDVSGLRVSKRRAPEIGGGGGTPLPASLPSNRSEAVRLNILLDSLLNEDSGGWEHRCGVYDQAFAEVVMQVANHCAERGEVLQRLRKFTRLCVRMERESREAMHKAQEQARDALAEAAQQRAAAESAAAELEKAQEKLDSLRAGLVRLKMLRAIHGRKFAAAELRIKELVRENEMLRQMLAEYTDEVPGEGGMSVRVIPGGRGLSGEGGDAKPLRASKSSKDGRVSGVDAVLGQLEALKKALEEAYAEIARLKELKNEAEIQLSASETEVSALMQGITMPAGGTAQRQRARVGGGKLSVGPGGAQIGGAVGPNGMPMGSVTSMGATGDMGDGQAAGGCGGSWGGVGAPGTPGAGRDSENGRGAPIGANGVPMTSDEELEFLRREVQKLKASLRWTRAMAMSRSTSHGGSSDGVSQKDGKNSSGGGGGRGGGGGGRNGRSGRAGEQEDSGRSSRRRSGRGGGGGAGDNDDDISDNGTDGQARSGRRKGRSSRSDGGNGADGSRRRGGRGDGGGGGGSDYESDYASDNGGRSRGGHRRRGGGGGGGGGGGDSGGSDEGSYSDGSGGRIQRKDAGKAKMSRGDSSADGNGNDNARSTTVGQAPKFSERGPKVRRHRPEPMITSLKGAKSMPQWMVHKAVGTLTQARIEYEQEMMKRGEPDEQEIGQFIEDRFIELYGKGKLATENLRDTIKGFKTSSPCHVRIKTFRSLCALVPGDAEAGEAVSESCGAFFKMTLRLLVEVLTEDHLSGFKGAHQPP